MSVRILTGDVIDVLRSLPDESVHCCITSPPYWGLRSYLPDDHPDKPLEIGIEPTMGEHIDTMVDVFREVRRVLRKDGTCWLNYGDCYATSPNGRSAADTKAAGNDDRTFRDKPFSTIGPIYDPLRPNVRQTKHPGGTEPQGRIVSGGTMKAKDLCMIPNRLAIALQDDGWWVRSEIIWAKPNPMPESVTDRPATAHEKIWLLTRSARYFYDAEAVRTGQDQKADIRSRASTFKKQGNVGNHHQGAEILSIVGANLRNVWTIPTKGFAGAHYATFPPDLIVPCIKAGTSEKGCCAECGAPWVRETGRDEQPQAYAPAKYDPTDPRFATKRNLGGRYQAQLDANPMKTLGWSPSCACAAATIPCTVLDPFIGSGTTAMVADRLGRDCIGIDLNPANVEMSKERITGDAGMFAEIV